MQIAINNSRVNEDDVTVFFTLIDDLANAYKWHGDFKKDLDLNIQLEAKKDQLYLGLLKKQYRGARPDKPDLSSMLQWIANGAENMEIINGKEVMIKIPKKEWKSTHPKPTEVEILRVEFEALKTQLNLKPKGGI